MALKNFLAKRMALGQLEKAFKDQFKGLKDEALKKVNTRKEIEQLYQIPAFYKPLSVAGVKNKEITELIEKCLAKEKQKRGLKVEPATA